MILHLEDDTGFNSRIGDLIRLFPFFQTPSYICMRTIGELCDDHGKHVSQGGKDPFYITVVEPLLAEMRRVQGLKVAMKLRVDLM